MKFFQTLVLTLAFFLTANCTSTGSIDDGSSADDKIDSTWPLDARTPFLKDLVHIKFKSGNIRVGYLSEDKHPEKVTITKTADEGVYHLWEIQWVMRSREVIFPRPQKKL